MPDRSDFTLESPRLTEATPGGVIPRAEHLEELQERHEWAVERAERRTKEARDIRRFIAEQPKRLVNLTRATAAPGTPFCLPGDKLCTGLPHGWIGSDVVNRLGARQR